jgi:UDP-N-acetylmuramate dehydrogenase
MNIQENVSLAPLTTLRVGGPARYFVEALNVDDVRDAIKFAQSKSLPLFVLGGGSNLVVLDSGWPGLVLKVAIRGFNHRHGHEVAYFDAGAGGLGRFRIAHRGATARDECLSGIPGSVGGTSAERRGLRGRYPRRSNQWRRVKSRR